MLQHELPAPRKADTVLNRYKCSRLCADGLPCGNVLHNPTLNCSIEIFDEVIECLPGQACRGREDLGDVTMTPPPLSKQQANKKQRKTCLDSSKQLSFATSDIESPATSVELETPPKTPRRTASPSSLRRSPRRLGGSSPSPTRRSSPRLAGKCSNMISNKKSGVSHGKPTKAKTGPKLGSTRLELSADVWYNACEKYTKEFHKTMKPAAFLKSNECHHLLNGSWILIMLLLPYKTPWCTMVCLPRK